MHLAEHCVAKKRKLGDEATQLSEKKCFQDDLCIGGKGAILPLLFLITHPYVIRTISKKEKKNIYLALGNADTQVTLIAYCKTLTALPHEYRESFS